VTKRRLIAVDIDGTVADNAHRITLLRSKEKLDTAKCNGCRSFDPHDSMCLRPASCTNKTTPDEAWAEFESLIPDDAPMPRARECLETLTRDGAGIIFVTGRSESSRASTIVWLMKHGFKWEQLLMRPVGDRRDATDLKKSLLRPFMRDLLMVIDDDVHFLDSLSFYAVTAVRPHWDALMP
jgi:hypothetical protein